jgi:hypothetical protein
MQMSQQNGAIVQKANSNFTATFPGLGERKYTKPQPQPSAYLYGYLAYIIEVPLSDAPVGTRLGYLEFETKPQFSVPSTDDNLVSFDPVGVTPFTQTNNSTVLLSCPSFDAQLKNSVDDTVVFSFLNSDAESPVLIGPGGSQTTFGFPAGSSAENASLSLEDIFGEVKVIAKKVPGITNLVEAGKNVYKIYKDKASATVNAGAAELGGWISENISPTLCGELTDLSDSAVTAFGRGCRSPPQSSTSIPDGAVRVDALVRSSDSVIVLDYLPANGFNITYAAALLGGEAHAITIGSEQYSNNNGYGYFSSQLTSAAMHESHLAMLALNPHQSFSVYLTIQGSVIKHSRNLLPRMDQTTTICAAINDSGIYKLKADCIHSSHYTGGSKPALAFITSTDNPVTINGADAVGGAFLVNNVSTYVAFRPMSDPTAYYYFSANPGVVVMTVVSAPDLPSDLYPF